MQRYHDIGIIVDSLPFRDYDCILTVFTPKEGLIKLIIRAAYSTKKGKGGGITTPLSSISFCFSKGNSGLYPCHDIAVHAHRLDLRKDLTTLQAACDMIQAIAATQQPGKPAEALYHLLEAYLQKLPTARNSSAVAASFRLKLLRYEGLLGFLSHCSVCAAALKECRLHQGGAFCPQHAPRGGLTLSEDERTTIEHLAYSRNFLEVSVLEIPSSLAAVIERIYNEMLGQ